MIRAYRDKLSRIKTGDHRHRCDARSGNPLRPNISHISARIARLPRRTTGVMMNEELSKKLLNDFPRLYRNREQSSMDRGFECGNGWFELIYELSRGIETVARECGLTPDSPEWPRCRQEKEKFGSLRFVVFATDQHRVMHERISQLRLDALNQSVKTCEYCGKPGELVRNRGIAVLCPEHARLAAIDPDFLPPGYLRW